MTDLIKPKRKNPQKRTRLPTTPPAKRSREAMGLTAAAAEGRFELQVCEECGTVQYPPRQVCGSCLGVDLAWKPVNPAGTMLAETTLEHSNDLYFRERLPWRVGMVKMDAGPSVVANLTETVPEGGRVRLTLRLDRAGQAVMTALPERGGAAMEADPSLRETACDPKFRKVLITDGTTETGQAIARAMLKAEAGIVYIGRHSPWRAAPGLDALADHEAVRVVPLDVTDSESVAELGRMIGAKVDILINTSCHLRMGGIDGRRDINTPRDEMNVLYFGLMRLAQEFGPVMRFRAADGGFGACAWVNVLSIYGLVNNPAFGTYSAAMAAARSLSQCLRAEMRGAGVRVVNVYPGPTEDEWNQLVPPPRLPVASLASAITKALKTGTEDVYPGAVAEEIRERLRENPKEIEREITL